MDEQLAGFLRNFSQLTNLAGQASEITGGTPLLPVVTEHLGTEPGRLPVVVESFAAHRLADASGILDELADADPDSRIHGLAGQQRHHMELSDLVAGHGMNSGWIGEPDYETVSVGPDEEKRIISFGLFLFTHDGMPLAVLLRQANPQYGREKATLEVLGPDPDTVDGFLKHFKASLTGEQHLPRTRHLLHGQRLFVLRCRHHLPPPHARGRKRGGVAARDP